MNTFKIVVLETAIAEFVIIAESEKDAQNYFKDGLDRKGYLAECTNQESKERKVLSVRFEKEGNDYGY